ncbi:hypothetical protein HGRIS_001102 [Hohenbuehelia grisea]|uniref:Uncharacterized protein n=1 Tax=Hohenbuehelia grisea TaxID=104357 RepID=A0ABR3JN92_9AGAR
MDSCDQVRIRLRSLPQRNFVIPLPGLPMKLAEDFRDESKDVSVRKAFPWPQRCVDWPASIKFSSATCDVLAHANNIHVFMLNIVLLFNHLTPCPHIRGLLYHYD